MKNAMKKLTSLLLVAVLLVGALPFAASAAETDPCTKDFNCLHTGVSHIAGCPMIPCTNSDTCDHGGYSHVAGCPKACNGQLDCAQYAAGHTEAAYHMAGCLAISKAEEPITNGTACTNSYDCKHVGNNHVAGCPMIPCSGDASCDHGGWNHLETCPYACKNSGSCHADYHLATCPVGKKAEEPTTEPTTKPTEKPTEPENDSNNQFIADEEFQHDIWLYIYVNNDMITPAKRILLNNYAIVDASQDGGILTKAEILSVVDDYYKATDANKGIIWQGAYREDSLDIVKFVFKNDETPFVSLAAERTASTVVIKARVTGVTAINSAKADSSNPKTGDSIFTAMTVMGLSAASLAAVMFVYNKKRQTV